MGLAENELDDSPLRTKLIWIGVAVVGVALIWAIVVGVMSLTKKDKHSKPKMAKITIIDAPPPPPPPPPKVQPKEPPKNDAKEVKAEQPKPVAVPTETLKMAGEASADGVAGLQAGNPVSEYKGQPLGDGGKAGGIGRAEFNVYLTRLQRLIQEELVRNPRFKAGNYRVPASVRLAEDGTVRAVELVGSTGNEEIDALMREELLRLIRKEPPPASAPLGFTVRVTNRMLN